MNEIEKDFFNTMKSFKSLNYSWILPDITGTEYGTLKIISHCTQKNRNDAVTVSSVVKASHAAPPAISRCMRGMEEKGYIRRFVNEQDRRCTFVQITEKGEEVLQKSDEVFSDFGTSVFQQMGYENIEALNNFLKQLRAIIQKELTIRKNCQAKVKHVKNQDSCIHENKTTTRKEKPQNE